MFFRQHDLGDRTAVDSEGLEQLWSMAYGLGMLDYHSHGTWTRPIRYLYPITA